ncbi:MAG: shikimate dehydrogenase [Betaproteobacteria bacterium]|nr:shikimate dehydrogenase [Betaproteobacteria bacterium]
MNISGATRVYCLLGDPLHKARTPEHFNGLFAQRGIDAVMVPLEVPDGALAEAFSVLRKVKNLDGLIITMPHKAGMAGLVDELEAGGRNAGAINAARRGGDGRWRGDMFDGRGYTGALAARGVDPRGKQIHLIGAGAVARAIGFALREAGAGAFTLVDVNRSRAAALAGLLEARVADEPEKADVVVNCTPLGMKEGDALPCDPARISPAAVVSDVTTKPEITPFLSAARARGHTVTTGRDMFEAQGELIAGFFGWR